MPPTIGKKLETYFKGATILTPFNTPAAIGFSKKLDLYLNDNELSTVTSASVAALN